MTLKKDPNESLMAYIRRFNDEAMQVDDYIDQATFQAMMNSSNQAPSSEISKKMSKTLSGLMEEAQKHTIVEALYNTGEPHTMRTKAQKAEGCPLRPYRARPPRSVQDKGKKSMYKRYNPLTTTQKEILN